MKSGEKNPAKELYNELRRLTCEELWEVEVPRFDRADSRERFGRVAVIRAVGVVFSESGTEAQQDEARQWLLGLLGDPEEKVRRYATTAMPKLGAGPTEEAALLALLRRTTNEREKRSLEETLHKIGGAETLKTFGTVGGLSLQTQQKVKANVAREESPSEVLMDEVLADFSGLRIHLRGRKGLESLVREEVEACRRTKKKFKVLNVHEGLVALAPLAAFSLGDLYALRCFGSVGLVLGSVPPGDEELAALIASPLSRRLFRTFTEGAMRYRLEFMDKGHQRGAVRVVVNRAYELCPEILNDAREAPWAIEVYPEGKWNLVELRPRLVPDPRFAYRQQDVPAASHPPLAACMARLAGRADREVVWDPFCGSGLELIESVLLGGVMSFYGTDLSDEAIAISRSNFAAAKAPPVRAEFIACDFRSFADELDPNAITLMITNPPLGRRVPIGDLRQLMKDLFAVAAYALRPGGRLVCVNPLSTASQHPALKLQFQQMVDLGGLDCRLEKYVKAR